MSDLFWLTEAQMERLRPFFPRSHGRPRVDAHPGCTTDQFTFILSL